MSCHSGKRGMTMVVVTHEMGFGGAAADRKSFLWIKDRKSKDTTPEQLFTHRPTRELASSSAASSVTNDQGQSGQHQAMCCPDCNRAGWGAPRNHHHRGLPAPLAGAGPRFQAARCNETSSRSFHAPYSDEWHPP